MVAITAALTLLAICGTVGWWVTLRRHSPALTDGWPSPPLLLLTAAFATVAATLLYRRGPPDLLHDLLPPTTEFPESALPLEDPAGATQAPPDAAGSPVPSPAPPTRLLFIPLALRGLTLRNRVIKAATFEAGCDAAGAPQPSLIAHHQEVAAGGTALTVVAYAAVSPDGKSFGTQLQMAEPARAGLTALSAAVHGQGGAVAVQLTHAGSFAKPSLGGCAGAPLAPSRIFNPAGFNFAREMTRHDMARICTEFGEAAVLAVECGVDALELHLGHGCEYSKIVRHPAVI